MFEGLAALRLLYADTFIFIFIHLADAFIQSYLQMRNTISGSLQIDTGSDCNTKSQALFRVNTN